MKYVRIFFTFIGYLTFTALIGAATFIYIGHKKARAKSLGQVVSNVNLADSTRSSLTTVAMTPMRNEEIAEPSPISTAVPTASAARKHRAKELHGRPKAKVKEPDPVAYIFREEPTPKEREWNPIESSKPKPYKQAKPSRYHKPAKQQASELPQCTLSFRATDNNSSPRTGKGRVNVYETTDLEKQVIKRMQDIRQLEAAANQIRYPYGN